MLASAGATVVASARRLDRLEVVAEDCRSAGLRVLAEAVDVADGAAVTAALQRIEVAVGRVGVLVVDGGAS